MLLQGGGEAGRGAAADFFVGADGEPERRAQRRQLGDGGERAGEKAFHVTGATAIVAPIGGAQGEGVVRPRLSGDGDDVKVSGEDNATRAVANADEQRLVAVIRFGQALAMAGVGRELGGCPVEQRAHVVAGYAGEGDELCQCVADGVHGVPAP